MSSFVGRLFGVSGRVAVITGSTRGLGRAMAAALYRAGATVVLNGRDEAKTAAAAAALREEAAATGQSEEELGKLFPIAGDVSQSEAAQHLVDESVRQCGGIDILINNAGVNAPEGPAADTTLETWQWVNRVNVEGPFLLSRAALPHLRASKTGGRLIFTSSCVGHTAAANNYAYGASKGAVLQMMRTLAVELAPTGVTVNCISPGIMDTDMNAKFTTSEAAADAALGAVPMRRFGRPEELQGVTLLLCSSASSYITGQSLLVDGGYTCQ